MSLDLTLPHPRASVAVALGARHTVATDNKAAAILRNRFLPAQRDYGATYTVTLSFRYARLSAGSTQFLFYLLFFAFPPLLDYKTDLSLYRPR